MSGYSSIPAADLPLARERASQRITAAGEVLRELSDVALSALADRDVATYERRRAEWEVACKDLEVATDELSALIRATLAAFKGP